LPLPVDQALYDTWEAVLGDVRRLVQGSDGLSVAEVAELAGERFHGTPPRGYLDVGGMLSRPRDITLDAGSLKHLDEDPDHDRALAALLGEYYVKGMKPSPLPRRLLRMKGEIDRGEGELRRKLRYLFWLN
jgi:hypothetical protein